MPKKIVFCFISSLLFISFLVTPIGLIGQEDASAIRNKINEYTQKIIELSKAKKTLKNEINYLNSQIDLALLQVRQTENAIKILKEEIGALTGRIDRLDVDLNLLSQSFIQQITQNYKLFKRIPPIFSILSGNFNDYFQHQKYLTKVQEHSRETLLTMETIRTNYDRQKTKKAQKQVELEQLQVQLAQHKADMAQQKKSKSNLLAVTKNNETKYQDLLRQAQSELAAIEAIIAGRGIETKVGAVKKGDKIAYVIQKESCSSSGTHLHFMVKKDNKVQNPFSYLSSTGYTNNSGGDPFNPKGNWPWPIQPSIKFNQGYGYTWAIQHTWVGGVYQFHTGIDIASTTSNEVLATHDGVLYHGSYSYGCKLQYVRVESDQDNTETLYLHVNYY